MSGGKHKTKQKIHQTHKLEIKDTARPFLKYKTHKREDWLQSLNTRPQLLTLPQHSAKGLPRVRLCVGTLIRDTGVNYSFPKFSGVKLWRVAGGIRHERYLTVLTWTNQSRSTNE